MKLIIHDWTIPLGKNGKIIIPYRPEISIKWHKMITSFALNKGHKQISATWKMKMKWSQISQNHALSPCLKPLVYIISMSPLAP